MQALKTHLFRAARCSIPGIHHTLAVHPGPKVIHFSLLGRNHVTNSSGYDYEHSGHFGHWSRIVKWCLYSVMLGGTGVYFFNNKKVHCHHEETQSHHKWKGMEIKLYQYMTCPFCSKTRAFLLAHNIPFESVEVHPIFKKEIQFSKYKKVPIVTLQEGENIEQLTDSSLIISILATYMINDQLSISDAMKLYPESTVIEEDGKEKKLVLNKHWLVKEEQEVSHGDKNDPRKEEAQWRAWADDHLVHLISPNVYRTFPEAYQAFDYHVKQGRFNGTWEGIVAKYGGAIAMWAISKRIKKKYNLQENVRIDLYNACNDWISAIGKKRRFMGGDKPNLADISVFGVLSVMEGLDSFDDLLTHTKVKRWYYATKQAIHDHQGQDLARV